MKLTSILFILFFVSANSFAQANDSLKSQFLKDWQRAKDYTKSYLDVTPAEKFGMRPNDSIRSFAEQMLHLAQGNVNLISTATGKDKIFGTRNLEKEKTTQTKDSVTYFVLASYDYAIEALKNFDATKMDSVVKRGTLTETRRAFLLKAFEHQTHHRGQCTIYIRMMGIKPPNERLF